MLTSRECFSSLMNNVLRESFGEGIEIAITCRLANCVGVLSDDFVTQIVLFIDQNKQQQRGDEGSREVH